MMVESREVGKGLEIVSAKIHETTIKATIVIIPASFFLLKSIKMPIETKAIWIYAGTNHPKS